MKKIKDFIYDYNDVLVALLIVAAAGIIIFWRVNVVMDYSSYVAKEPVKNIDVEFSGIDLTPNDVDDVKDAEVEPERPDEPDTEKPSENPVDPAPVDPTPVDPTPETPETPTIKNFSLVVPNGANWTKVGQNLQNNGIIEDYKAFVARVVVRKDDGKLKPGTFEVNSGMTIDQIIDVLINKK
ncbi:MAG: endolytic transglycosylase MltG [Clostridia bacterium]|nr:endolytic transglycosylase MltG [Clostridia bacterium]